MTDDFEGANGGAGGPANGWRDSYCLAATALFVAWFDRQVQSGAMSQADMLATCDQAAELLEEHWADLSRPAGNVEAAALLKQWLNRWLGVPDRNGNQRPL